MTQKQAQTIESALKRAAKEGVKILGEGRFNLGGRFWLVSSKNYATTNRAYVVKLTDDHQLECNCRAQGICKHRAVVHQVLKTLKDERQPEPSTLEQIHAMDQAKVAEQDAEMAARGQVWNAAQLRYEPAASAISDEQAVAVYLAVHNAREVPEPNYDALEAEYDQYQAEQQEALTEQLDEQERGLPHDYAFPVVGELFQPFSCFKASNEEALAAAGHGMIYRGQM